MFSREMLLGKAPSERDIEGLSTENAVSLTTPPSFLCHGADDKEVPVQNSLGYAKALADHRRPFELYVPHHGPHGFALGEPGSEQDWTPMCEKWLRAQSVV
jgi:acetyl esterase/lipase